MKKGNKIRHWRDALFTEKEIKWKRPPIQNIDDGRLDVIITVPLTELLEAQTQRAFGYGMIAMLNFHIERLKTKCPIDPQDIVDLFTSFGLPEIAEQIAPKGEVSHS